MAEAILMPRLSDTMTEGVIAAWHKKVGDPVKKGELLAEVETDKATMELESYKDGTLLHVGADKGQKLQVNDLLAIIGKPGEDISNLVKSPGGAAPQEQKPEKPKEESKTKEEPKQAASSSPAPQQSSADVSKMEEVILMPRLSDTMIEGVIAAWHKNVGDQVKKGDVLADIETDKATMELESYKEGKLLYQGAKPGEKIQVNDLLAIIGEEGKVDVNKVVAATKGGTAPQGASAPAEGGQGQKSQQAQESAKSAPTTETVETAAHSENGRIKASPLAKKLAADKGIDLKAVTGSGDDGRITKKDIENFKPAAQQQGKPVQQQKGVAQPQVQLTTEDLPVSQMRKVIAKRLAESKFTAPHFYLTMSIDMDKAVESRGKINETSPVKISFNDFVLKACAIALKQHPKVNSSWMGDNIRRYGYVNIGVAVAVEEGLLVPVVRQADLKSLSQIATEVKEFAQKPRTKNYNHKIGKAIRLLFPTWACLASTSSPLSSIHPTPAFLQ